MITPQLLHAELDENNRPLQQEQVVPIAMKCIGGLQKFRIPFKNLSEHDFEVDFYWVVRAGREVRDVLAMAPERMTMSHIKDMNVAGHMVDVGDGEIDFAGILADPVAASMKHCFVEHDVPEDPFRTVAASYRVLSSILD